MSARTSFTMILRIGWCFGVLVNQHPKNLKASVLSILYIGVFQKEMCTFWSGEFVARVDFVGLTLMSVRS